MDVFVLKIGFQEQDREIFIYPVILRSAGETILVDCGYEGFMPLIEAAAHSHGLSIGDLTGILITHHDMDHFGGLYEIREKYPSVKVYSSQIEEPYISGKKKSLRLQQAEDLFDVVPEDQKSGALHFQQILKSIRPVPVDAVFSDGDEPSFLRGARIISTPGHMPGHISIYIKEQKILIAADAVVYENGKLEIANPEYTLDLPEALQSIRKLRQLEIERMVCYHGGELTSGIHTKLDELIAAYTKRGCSDQ